MSPQFRTFTFSILLLSLLASPSAAQRRGARSTTRATPIVQAPVTKESERETLLRFCQRTDSTAAPTTDGVRLRTDCWKRMQLQGMGDSMVDARYQAAIDDFVAASRADSTRNAADSSTAAVNVRIAAIQRAVQESRLDDASRALDEVLALQPQNQRALALHDRVVALRRTRQLRRWLFGLAGAVLVVGLALALFAKALARRHEEKVEQRRVVDAQRKAVIEIVDGVGRGRIYTMEGPIFRIGSALSERPEERNDLVLSDEGAFISRYHCSIVKKDGRYFLIDSSLNGTYIGDELMERGEHRRLEDGAEFSIAGMARFKFLLM